MTPLLRSLRWGLSVVLACGLATLVGVALLARDEGSFIVRGRSMAPAIPLGALIRVTAVPAQQVRPGDIVTIRADNGVVVTHRVVRAVDAGADRYFALKGDANDTLDAALVPARSLIGRVDHYLPYAGFAAVMLTLPSGLLATLALMGSALFAICFLRVESAARQERPVDAFAS